MSTDLTLLTDTTSIATQVATLREMVVNGEIDPLVAFVNISRVAEVIDTLKKDTVFLDSAMNEYSKFGQKDVEVGICKVTQIEAGVKYDFGGCGDATLSEMYEKQDALKLQIKERENMLKTLRQKTVLLNDDTGELCELHPPVKTSKTTLKLTFKKHA